MKNTSTLFDGLTDKLCSMVRGKNLCEQWAKCPRVLSVKPLNDIYYSTTIFAYDFKWFVQWVIWNRDTTVQYAFYSAIHSQTLMYVFSPYIVNWCYSGIIMYLVYFYWCPGTIILKSISLSTHQSSINHLLDESVISQLKINQSIKQAICD